jgi:hypothetical protein
VFSVTLGCLFSVTLGLDPRVHPHLASPIDMDGRVKPGHDKKADPHSRDRHANPKTSSSLPLPAFFRHRRLSFSVTFGRVFFLSPSGVFFLSPSGLTRGSIRTLASPIDMDSRFKPGHDVFVDQYHFFSCHSERGEESLSDTAVARIR